jgi:uncharacterized protein
LENRQTKLLQSLAQAKKLHKTHALLLKRLAQLDSRKLDEAFHRLHEEVFGEIDCLDCANCCRSLGPRLTDADIGRIAGSLRMRPAQFTEKYLHLDEDGDYVFLSMPCPFLASDNRCEIYDDRPKACRDYPHTDRRRMYQLLDTTLKNSYTCPAVLEMLQRLNTGR